MKNQQFKRTTLNGWGKVLTVALLFSSSPLYAQRAVGMAQTTDQLPLPADNSPIQTPLPCLDSSPECVRQLTDMAIAFGAPKGRSSTLPN